MSQDSIPTAASPPTNPHDESVGQVLGRYKLLEKLGEGGFGAVWLAEQKEPVRRKVAFKIIKLGMDTRAVVARFEAERQALAMMDHPNIAKVLDAGATESGRPFFVMELVRGIRITDYCDQNHLTTRDRLDLFIKVCQAIQHAHQKGIIHRDIKPSNILVTLHDGVPVPKVIDFGIAKATQGELTDKTVHTQFQQFIGTPAYMSPEQAEMSGLDIDTRSDIYSLGVLLYELLTGRTPFDANELMSQGIDAMRKTIREKDPVRSSTKLATLQGEERTTTAKRHATDMPRLVHQLKGDLDWIVMKCLEKDRTRRYETANGLAADLKRHLNNETVVARPPSAGYRFQKMVRRNKALFTAVTSIFAALLLGMIISAWQAVRAKRAEALARQSRNDAEKLSNFIIDDLYGDLQPSGQLETVARLARQALAYYDSLPPSLRTADTLRNRAMAQARLALVTARQEDKAALSLADEAIAELEQRRSQGDRSEGTVYSLGLALEAQYWCYSSRLDLHAERLAIEKAAELLRPAASAANASPRLKIQFANALNFLSHLVPPDHGVTMCEEALRTLEGIGALTLADLSASSAWADIADSEAREAFSIGRIDQAEKLEKQVQTIAERVLEKRPADLRARLDLTFAPDVLALIAVRRMNYQLALNFQTQCEKTLDGYLRYNPSDAINEGIRYVEDFTAAGLHFQLGNVAEALNVARTAAQLSSEKARAAPMLWTAVARYEAQLGKREPAEEALDQAKLSLDALSRRTEMLGRSKECWTEYLHDAERKVKLAFGEDSLAFTLSQEALARIAKLQKDEEDPEISFLILFQQQQSLFTAARAAINLSHFAGAESSARAALPLSRTVRRDYGDRLYLDQPGETEWARVLLAHAVAAQHRNNEALTILEPALTHYRDAQRQGATHVGFRQQFARAVYVQALAQPTDPAGVARRQNCLEEAAQLLRDLPEEARQLHDTKELLSWIADAQDHPSR